jgi:hypothetical protein
VLQVTVNLMSLTLVNRKYTTVILKISLIITPK